MQKTHYLLILLIFFAVPPCLAQDNKKADSSNQIQTFPPHYKKDSLNHWEWLYHMKSHLNPLQTFPVLNSETIELDIGPAQFQITIPFR